MVSRAEWGISSILDERDKARIGLSRAHGDIVVDRRSARTMRTK